MNKSIETIFKRPLHHAMVGDGFRVYNYFPNGYRIREKTDPFLMLDFGPAFDFGPSTHPKGVDVHPHKGFETVTIAYKGSVEHYDSSGHHGVIHPGDVQWMTAGSGILHKEFHEKEFSKQGGPFEMIQLWVNLPAKHKLSAPGYQALKDANINRWVLNDDAGVVKVIAGQCGDISGSAKTYTEMNVWDIRLKKGGSMVASIPDTHNTLLLVVDGEVAANGQLAGKHDMILFGHQGEEMSLQAGADETVLLLLSGIPIQEPIAQYGPFVMNTEAELHVAMDEYHSGKFGILV
jgi:redox-sensitive bicupin YhaK (pirin superfamily)